MKTFRIFLWVGVLIMAGVLGWLTLAVTQSKTKMAEGPFGVPFQLTDQSGKPITEQAFRGKPTALFFGFTHCPEVCPTTLFELDGWLAKVDPDKSKLQAYFVSVDPERDTPEVLADYLGYFDPRIVGVTGEPGEVARILGDFRAKAERIEDLNGDYTMNHTAGVFLFRADGSFGSIIDFHEDRRFAVPKIRRAMKKEQP